MATQRLYQEYFPHHQVPNVRTFVAIDRHLTEIGSFSAMCERPRTVLQPEQVLKLVDEQLEISLRRAAAREGVAQNVIWRLFHDQLLHPCHFQCVHALERTDNLPQRSG